MILIQKGKEGIFGSPLKLRPDYTVDQGGYKGSTSEFINLFNLLCLGCLRIFWWVIVGVGAQVRKHKLPHEAEKAV